MALKGTEISVTHQAAVQLPDQREVDPLISVDQRHLNQCCPLTPWHLCHLSVSVLLCLSICIQCVSLSVCLLVCQSLWVFDLCASGPRWDTELCSWRQSLALSPSLFSPPLHSVPVMNRMRKRKREKDKIPLGSFLTSSCSLHCSPAARGSRGKERLKNAAVEQRVQPLCFFASLLSCPLSLSLADTVVIIQQSRVWGERHRGVARQSGTRVAALCQTAPLL